MPYFKTLPRMTVEVSGLGAIRSTGRSTNPATETPPAKKPPPPLRPGPAQRYAPPTVFRRLPGTSTVVPVKTKDSRDKTGSRSDNFDPSTGQAESNTGTSQEVFTPAEPAPSTSTEPETVLPDTGSTSTSETVDPTTGIPVKKPPVAAGGIGAGTIILGAAAVLFFLRGH